MQPPPFPQSNDPMAPPPSNMPLSAGSAPPPARPFGQWPGMAPPPTQQQQAMPVQQTQQTAPRSLQNNDALALVSQSSSSNGEIVQLRRAVEEQSTNVRDVLASLKDVLLAMKEKSNGEGGLSNDVNLPALLQAMQNASDIKSELSAIKTLLLASFMRGGGVSVTTTGGGGADESQKQMLENLLTSMALPVTTNSSAQAMLASLTDKNDASVLNASTASAAAAETNDEEDEDAKKMREGMEKARQALGSMVTGCADDDLLSSACGMLLMFLKNLLKEPSNPRYRRVAKGNANFKKALDPVNGYLEFFEAVGFEERGSSQLELKQEWVENLETLANDPASTSSWAKAILDDAVANLEAIREQRSPYVSTMAAVPSVVAPTPGPVVAAAVAPPPVTKLPPVVAAKWQVPSSASAVSATRSVSTTPPPAVITKELPPPVVAVVSSPADAPNGSAEPAYPKTFAEIIRLQQEGIKPPGIKEIPDRLSADEPSKPNKNSVPKPWEVPATSSPVMATNMYTGGLSRVEIQELSDEEDNQ